MTTTTTTTQVLTILREKMTTASQRIQTGAYSGAAMQYDMVRKIMSAYMLASFEHNGRVYTQTDIVRLVRQYNHA